MIIGNSSIPTRIHNLGYGEEGTFIQSKSSTVIEHGCGTTLGPGNPEARPLFAQIALLFRGLLCSALWFCEGLHCAGWVCSSTGWSALLHHGLLHSALARLLQCFSSARDMQSSMKRENTLWESEGSWLIWTKVPNPGPWLVCPPANKGCESSQFDWSNRHCPDWTK